LVYPKVVQNARLLRQVTQYAPPISGQFIKNGYDYLIPENHEGIDLHHPIQKGSARPTRPAKIQLIAPGECLYLGKASDCHDGQMMIFRHQQPDGSQLLSVYGHLSELAALTPGQQYPELTYIGMVDNDNVDCGRYLHFALAYGATWDIQLHQSPTIPEGAGIAWIRERYLEPVPFLKQTASGENGFLYNGS
jgi:hypothetical protein